MPRTIAAISPLTFATARPTPLPCQRSPPSRSSVASNSPVEAPDGTAAWPWAPDRSPTSTSTVGFPRLSSTWRAWIRAIALTGAGHRRGHAALCSPMAARVDRGYFVVVVLVCGGVVVCGTAGVSPVEVLGALYSLQFIPT